MTRRDGQNEMVRDKFVFGLQDNNLKECLLHEADISLSKIVTLAQRAESLQRHIREMTDTRSNKSTDAVQVSCVNVGINTSLENAQPMANDASHGISESMWLSTITILGNKSHSTGAEASVLPLKVYKRLKDKPMMENTATKLSAYGGSVLTPVGTCVLKCNFYFYC